MHDWRGPVAPPEEASEGTGFDNATTGAQLLAPWRGVAAVLRLARRTWPVMAAGAREVTRDLVDGAVRFEARHHIARGSAAIKALATGVAVLMIVGTFGALGLADPDARTARPTLLAATTRDPLAHLRLRVPAVAVAGAAVSADETPAAEAAEPAAAPVTSATAAARPAPNLLPTGKGMWFHHLEQAGSIDAVIGRAQQAGLTHVYVRVGSSKTGFYAREDLNQLLPAAHAAGLKVVGWDFPYLDDVNADVARALEAIAYTTPDGHRIDAFSADIETGSEGVRLAADRVDYYAGNVRYYVGPGYPLIGTVPNACTNDSFPYAEVARHFDAIAPMVYWITRDPGADVACNMTRLAPLGRAVLPIGQAYDPAIDNPRLVGLTPGYHHLELFMRVAAEHGAAGVSFWAWHTASDDMWNAIRDAGSFSLVPMAAGHGDAARVVVLQRLLNTYGYAAPIDGRYEAATVGALAQLQSDLGLDATGQLDPHTIRLLTGRV